MPKDSPNLLQEIDRLQKLTPKRLDKLEQQNALIVRSVAQTGLVTNTTIAQLEGKAPLPQENMVLATIKYYPRLALACLVMMIVIFFATDYVLSKLIAYYFHLPNYLSWLEMIYRYWQRH
ncbi:MAG: hypothetical protein RMK91_05950 [Pseudanabaenaceae cyanobacterium SKYGB_i_bin29]|nr:hypothetical protein [Pseudanabaenaceae cyanobacterium SKYG29]MDW8421394.1 hypothetical protein [Pseudanabaenaceae cyanobacterium SKYGB_i_bin29]